MKAPVQTRAYGAGPEQSQFIAQQIAATNRMIRFGLATLFLGILPIGVWLGVGKLSSAVIAPGVVKVDLDWHPVQHAEGGTVGEVKVRKGQKVTRGEPLIVLADVHVDSDVQRISTRINVERVGLARFRAEQSMSRNMELSQDIILSEDPHVIEIKEREQRLFRLGRDALDSQDKLLRDMRRVLEKEIVALEAQAQHTQQSLKLQASELAANQRLVAAGFISETRISQLEGIAAELGAKLEEKHSDTERARQRLIDNQLRAQALASDYRDRASEQLRNSSGRLADLEQELRKYADAAGRQVILAPVSGELIEMVVKSAGEVIAPRQPIAYIVPDESPLVVEARVRAEDIAQVREGLAVTVHLSALSHLPKREVEGTLKYISSDRIENEQTNLIFYRAQVEVSRASLAELGLDRLVPGMPAEVYIAGSTRTPFEYLVEPLAMIIRRSVREY